jgi:hypothetical protein
VLTAHVIGREARQRRSSSTKHDLSISVVEQTHKEILNEFRRVLIPLLIFCTKHTQFTFRSEQ